MEGQSTVLIWKLGHEFDVRWFDVMCSGSDEDGGWTVLGVRWFDVMLSGSDEDDGWTVLCGFM